MSTKIDNGLYLIDNDFQVLYFNASVKEMYPEMEVGKHCYECIACRNNPCTRCPVKEKEQITIYNSERSQWVNAQAADVELPELGRCTSVTFSLLSDNNENQMDISAVYNTDISVFIEQQKKLEEQNKILSQQNRLMEFINDGMPGGYHRCGTGEGYPFLYVSNKFLNMLGFTRDELKENFDDKFLNLIHPDDREMLESSSDNAVNDGEASEIGMNYRIRTKDGYMQVLDTSRVSEYEGEKFFQGVIIDISQEQQLSMHMEQVKRVQGALEDALKRETLYRYQIDNLQHEILDSISCGVFAYTLPERKLIAVNDTAKDLIGCGRNDDPVEAMREFILKKIVPEDRENVMKTQKHLKKNGEAILRDYSAVVNGELVHIHSNTKYLQNADGQPYVLITMLDTTKSARLTRILEKERMMYRDALASGSEFSFIFDVTTGVISEEFITAHDFNLIKALGFTAPVQFDALMKKYEEVFTIEFATEEMKSHFTCKGLVDEFEKGRTNVVTEYYNIDRDLFFRVNCLMYRDDDNGHIKAAVVADDITEIRKKDKLQREELKAAYDEMNVRFDTTLNGISGGFKIAAVDDNFRYTYISEGAAQLQGYTVDEFLKNFGHRVTSNIHIEDGEAALAEAMRQIKIKGNYAVKYRVPHKDGSIKWVIDRGKFVEDSATGKKYLYILMQDVTELEERNMQLDNVLSMQKDMADSLGNGIFAYTLPERKILILNQEAQKMFNYIGSVEGQHGFDIISKIIPEDMPEVRRAVKKLVKPGDEVEYIFHSDTEQGDRRAFKCNTKLMRFDNGQRYILSAITDITEQERAELRLEQERKVYRDALVLGSSGVFTVDLTYGYVEKPVFTEQGENLMEKVGVTLPADYDTFAKAWFDEKRIVSDSKQIKLACSAEGLIKAYNSGTAVLDIEYSVPEDNRYFHLIILLYNNNNNNRHFATFIVYDVTSDRDLAKQRRNIINSLGRIYLALYHLSLKDNKCSLIKANDDIREELSESCDFDYFCKFYVENYVEPEFRQAVFDFLQTENIRAALQDTDTETIEFKRKGMGWCRISLVAAERDKDNVVNSVVFAGNVVEKQKLEELARQEALEMAYESANIANEAKTNFLANMSHDIRTPMNAIIGMTAIAGTHLDDRERVADCLSKISISSKHLLGLINEVLDMSKIESGKIEMLEDEFNITDLIENLLAMSKSDISSKNHKLSVSVGGIIHENVVGDSQRLQQVFMNLMSNAIKYTPPGGKIKLTITEKQTNKPNIACYEMSVEDNGIGMSEETVKHIFEPFARASDDKRLDKIQGTGLGMSITKSILHMMNGDITVESELNVGSKFTATFFLSVRNDDEEISYDKFVDLPILVVDDDESSCIYACELLDEIGMKGEWVLTGEEAVHKTVSRHNDNNDFFAVILDWKMPDMDGVETARQIRSRVGKDVPIIIISSYDWSDIELTARAAGVNAFISKPMFKSRVVHVFNELIGDNKDKKDASSLDVMSNEDFTGRRVLLVEDNELNAEIAGEIFGMAGFEIEYAVNGKEAVDIMTNVEDGHFDIIFMDIQMPVLNGYEATRAIRTLPGDYAKSVPIFAMTANAFAEDVAAAKNAGMNDHIAKPLDFERLMSVIKRWLK